MPAAVEIRDVVKTFDDIEALKGISANIEAGRLTGLVGPDGSGKTTLIRLMGALMKPTEGQIRLLGKDVVTFATTIHANTGYMPQRFGLYEELSVLENLELYARLRGVKADVLESTFAELLRFTRLEQFTKRRAGKLSGGMKRNSARLRAARQAGRAAARRAQRRRRPDQPARPVGDGASLKNDSMTVVWSTAYLDEAMPRRGADVERRSHRVRRRAAQLAQRVVGRTHRLVGIAETAAACRRAVDPKWNGAASSKETRSSGAEQGAEPAPVRGLAARHGGRLGPAVALRKTRSSIYGGGPVGAR